MPRCCCVTCGPNEVLVVSGCCIRKSVMMAGGRVFVFPFCQEVRSLPLNIMTLHVESPKVYTIQGVPISVTGIAQIKIQSQNREMLETACEMFLGKDETEIATIALVTLEGHQRAIMGAMTVEEIYQDRKKFSENVFEVASSDLINMGITVVSYTIKDISDEEGYLQALGMKRTAEVKRDAKTGEATAKKDAQMREAQAEMERINSRLSNDTEIARSKRDYQLQKYGYEVESLKKKAEAEMSFALREAQIKQKLAEEKGRIEIVERVQQIALENEEIKRKTEELKANINVAADAEKYRLETLANAKRDALILQAEGEAESIRLKGEAEAFAISSKAKAEVNQMEKKAEALNQYSEAAVMDMVLDSLPKVVEEIAVRFSETNKITIVSSGPGEIGPAKITQEIFEIICKVPEAIKLLTGVDITRTIQSTSNL